MELTLEIARRSSEDGFLDLSESEVTRITNKAAEFLSQNVGSSLNFYYLTELSDEAAEFLSKFKGDSISLGRAEFNEEGYEKERGYLTKLSDMAIEALSKFNGPLSLDGLAKLSDAAAESLSKHQGGLGLDGLTELSDAAAESLSKHDGHFYLSLIKLSDAAAESFGNYKGPHLNFNRITKLSASAAKSLSKFCGESLELGLIELSEAVAESLSNFRGYSLSFSSLSKLSDSSAESLSKFSGGKLDLDCLTEISDSSAKALSKFKGSLSLRTNIPNLSLTVITELCKVESLNLRITKKNLTREHAKAIAGFKGRYLSLDGFASLSDECAHELSNFKGEELNLTEYHKIIPKLSRDGARALCEILGLLANSGSFDYKLVKKAEVDLDSEQDRSPDYVDEDFAQKWIRGSSWTYSLGKAKKISNEAAVRLGQHEDEYAEFQLCNLNELSETAAVALAKCRGKLWLDGLTEFSDAVVEALAKHEGKLSLDGVTELSDAAAQSLSKHRGELSLSSVGKISEQAATAMLQKPAGTINGMIPAEWVANLSQ